MFYVDKHRKSLKVSESAILFESLLLMVQHVVGLLEK